MSNQILGGKILKLVKERCQSHNNYFQGKLLTILMFQPPESETDAQKLAQYQAAVTSTNQKESVITLEIITTIVRRSWRIRKNLML
jgi:hypothetical protein